MNSQKVLIIDPDEASRQYIGFEIKNAGYEVDMVASGKEGLIEAWRGLPQIIIIDPNLQDISAEQLIDKLKNDQRTSRCKFIAFSSLENPNEIQHAINLSFDHYIPKEMDALPTILQAIQELISPKVSTDPSAAEPTPATTPESAHHPPVPHISYDQKLIVFLSAKGGTGTSSICANFPFFINESSPDSKIAVLDSVLPIGSIASLVSYDGPLNFVEAAEMTAAEISTDYLHRALPDTGIWKFQLLAGSPNPDQSNELDITRLPVLLNKLRESFDYLLVDVGRALSRITLPIILDADQVVLVLGPERSTVALTKVVWDFLQTRGMNKTQIYPIINRAVGVEGLTKSEIEDVIGLNITGSIPYMQDNFSLANNLRVPVGHKFPEDAVTISIRYAVREVEDRVQRKKERRLIAT